jgi:ABC-type multidrug transport system ATPase subunit/predicted component of type VI protein secretion system/ABC-type multidrug transport system permease subunit
MLRLCVNNVKYVIQVLSGAQSGKIFSLDKATATIGRDPQNDIVLTDQSVSRAHARFQQRGSQWSIEKLAVGNSLSINQRVVDHGAINHNDKITLGVTALVFLVQPIMQQPSTPTPPPAAAYNSSAGRNAGNDSILFTQRAYQRYEPPAGIPSLVISANTSNARQVIPLTKARMSIGRDSSNDIVIGEQVVSGLHALIERRGSDFYIVHPHPQAKNGRTTNGLLYQGRHILGNQAHNQKLMRGDIYRIGDQNGTLVTLTFNDGSGAIQEVLPEIRPIPLTASPITIGRHSSNTVSLRHPQVSAYHARIEQVTGGYRLTDLNSTNHTFVNGQAVSSRMLQLNDEMRIGPFKLTYTGTELRQVDESGGIRIDAVNLMKQGNNAVVLLNDISLVIPPRKFVALVGGSGTGKSTLMDALNGLRPAQQGRVYYNGQDYYSSTQAFSTQLGYVPQDDIVHRDLTVERALYYAARMRLPEDFTEEQIFQCINEVLVDVEMTEQRNLLVSKLSGGQRKRVSIALELLSKPSIFFLDEPTSGLDPGLDRKMMFLLRKLADKGQTIVLVTHATNNINVCDYVCFLATGGRLAYFGPPEEAKTFFNKSDFAEIYGELDTKEASEKAATRFRNSPEYQQYVQQQLMSGPAGPTRHLASLASIKPAKRGDPWKQFFILSRRYIQLLKNDTGNLLILLLQAPIIALILVLIMKNVTHAGLFTYVLDPNPQTQLVYNGDAQKVLFVMSFAAVMFGCINGAREIVKELPIYRRERAVNLGILPYLFSKIVVLGILCLLQSLVLVTLVNAAEPFAHGVLLPVNLEVYITVALTSLAGLMVGLLVSALAPNNDRAVSLIPIILIPQVIFAGAIFPLKNGPLQPFGILFAVRWAMAALGTSLGLNSDLLGGDQILSNISSYQYGQGDARRYLLLMWLALVVMIVLLGLLTSIFLKRKDMRK